MKIKDRAIEDLKKQHLEDLAEKDIVIKRIKDEMFRCYKRSRTLEKKYESELENEETEIADQGRKEKRWV